MNKKQRRKSTKLAVQKETVAHLTSSVLKQVAGGLIPETRQSVCVTACTNC